MTATIGTLAGMLKAAWRPGVPRKLYDDASPAFAMCAKARSPNWSGAGLTDGASGQSLVYNYGMRLYLPAAGRSTYNGAWTNTGSTTNVRVQATLARYYAGLGINHDALDAAGEDAPTTIYPVKAGESEGVVHRALLVLSGEFLGNGGGAIGRINGTGAAATGTTFQLKNRRSVLAFTEGTVIDFSATDGTSGSPRGVSRIVTSVDLDQGIITVNSDLTGSGVLDNDWVFFESRHGAAFTGLRGWCPQRTSQLSSSFFGIDQTRAKLGGHRVSLKPGSDPVSRVLNVLRRLDEVSGKIDCLLVTPLVMQQLQESTRFHQFAESSVGDPRRANPLAGMYEMNNYSADAMDADAARYSRFGFDGIRFRWPEANRDVSIYSDRWLIDHDVVEEQDDLMLGYNYQDVEMPVLRSNGWDWQDHDGNGPVYQVEGQDEVAAIWAARGQIVVANTNNLVTAGSNVGA